MKRTLVVHTGGIGDLLLACPALIRLAEEGPVELLGRPDRLALPLSAGIARATHDLDQSGFETLFSEPARGSLARAPDARLRGLLSRFERCVVWMRDDGTIARALRDCGVADVRVFAGLPPNDWNRHASHYYLERLGYEPRGALHLPIAPAATRRDVILHPGSGGPHKNWPLDRYVAVAHELERHGRGVTWCMGPAEANMTLPSGGAVLQTQDLVMLARELATARLYIGNDSGVTHLAAAVGCRTIAVFGPTNPKVWAPLGNHVTAVQGTPWPEVEDVLTHAESG
jgi:hypothetical protein